MTRRDESKEYSPYAASFLVPPMTYTQGLKLSKQVAMHLLQFRARMIRLWLRTFGPRWTVGCLAVLRDDDGRVCLLRHRGRIKPWGLPGGLVEWPELPESGLIRELQEELNWNVGASGGASVPFQLAASCVSENFAMLELIFIAGRSVSSAEQQVWKPQDSEVSEIRWFSAHEIAELAGLLERHRSVLLDVLRSR